MAKTIDLMDGVIKTKISLAVDEKTVSLLDDAVFGFKLIYLLSNNGGKLESLTGSKNYAAFKSLINRSEMVDKLIQAVRAEKIFVLGSNVYSLNDLRSFAVKLASDIDLDYLIDLTLNCNVDQNYLDTNWGREFIEMNKDKTIEETIKSSRRFIQNVPLVYKNEYYGLCDGNDKMRGIESMGLFSEIVEYNQIINTNANHLNAELTMDGSEANYRGDELQGELYEILNLIFKNSSIAFGLEMKCRIVRNKLFGENHPTTISLLDAYYALICYTQPTMKGEKSDETP